MAPSGKRLRWGFVEEVKARIGIFGEVGDEDHVVGGGIEKREELELEDDWMRAKPSGKRALFRRFELFFKEGIAKVSAGHLSKFVL